MDGKIKGPGALETTNVGTFGVAKTTLLDKRFTMAYAAGISDDNGVYFHDDRAGSPQVHPCIAFSLQWAARFRPDQSQDPRVASFGVHASTDLVVHRPFKSGEAITTQGQLLQMRQISPGVYNVDLYRMTSSTGELVAELYYNGITRGATLMGSDAVVGQELPPPKVSDGVSETPVWKKEIFVPLHAAQQYTECAQIYNPIHTEPSVAKAAGLPDMILHGSATKALALTAIIGQYFDGNPELVTRLFGQLRGMVLMNTSIQIEVLAEQRRDNTLTLVFRVVNSDGQLAISNGVVTGRLRE